MATLTPSAQKVQDVLDRFALGHQVQELERSARSAAEAAAAVGCSVGQIAKSLVFRTEPSNRAVLVICSGSNRVDERKVADAVGETIRKADADFVRDATGFAIGGVPPVGHARPLEVFIDADMLDYPEIWAAAGNPNAVFRLTPAELVKITGGRVVAVQ